MNTRVRFTLSALGAGVWALGATTCGSGPRPSFWPGAGATADPDSAYGTKVRLEGSLVLRRCNMFSSLLTEPFGQFIGPATVRVNDRTVQSLKKVSNWSILILIDETRRTP